MPQGNKAIPIYTSIRPIKKLFILKKDDINTFIQLVKNVSSEIAGLKNIFLMDDADLFIDNTMNFINMHDPDVIINYSDIDNNILQLRFGIPVYNKTSININKLSTYSHSFTDIPEPYDKFKTDEEYIHTFVVYQEDITQDNIANLLACGYMNNKEEIYELFRYTPFKKVLANRATSITDLCTVFKAPSASFLYFFYNFSYGSRSIDSIQFLDYNPKQYIINGSTIIIANENDLKSMIYFWNQRASYPYSKLIWIQQNMLNELLLKLPPLTHFIDFTDNIQNLEILRTHSPQIEKIDNSIYYYCSYDDDWKNFENYSIVNMNENNITVTHPNNKLFSRSGFNPAIMLDIYHIEEAYFHKRIEVGKLFTEKMNDRHFPEYFSRISNKGLSVYYSQLQPMRTIGVIQNINIPSFDLIMETYFKIYEYSYRETNKTSIVKSILSIIGNIDEYGIFRDEQIFNLIIKMTPKRIDRIVKEVSREIDNTIDENKIESLLIKNIGDLQTITSDIIIDLDQLMSICEIRREEASAFLEKINHLCLLGILIRGKKFKCPNCKNNLWFTLSELKNINTCYYCQQSNILPFYEDNKVVSDYFKLNELFIKAVDQGQLTMLLLLYILNQQKFYAKRYLYNIELLNKSDELMTDIDIVFTLGSRIGIGEVKSNRCFDLSQALLLIEVAEKIKADFIVFSSLLSKETKEIRDFMTELSIRHIKKPVFIFTKESLFKMPVVDLRESFQRNNFVNEFDKGPVLL